MINRVMKTTYTNSQLISLYEKKSPKGKKKSKPDFMDVDKDGNKSESMKKAIKDKKSKSAKKTIKESLTFADAVKFVLEK